MCQHPRNRRHCPGFICMSQLTAQIPRNRFLPLSPPTDSNGDPRRIGIEIEFGHLDTEAAAKVARSCLGGEIEQKSTQEYRLTGSAIGKLKIYLDTAYRGHDDSAAGRVGLDLAQHVVPVEIVTEPLPPEALPECERLREALRDAGALGSRNGALLGFGVHLNPAVAGESETDILPVVRAYALLEDWLRGADPLDLTRRLLPFSRPYPRGFVDLLAERPDMRFSEFWDLYLEHNATRNRGLDLLPIMAKLDPNRMEATGGKLGKVNPRPAYHYRLPDSRVDESDWSLAYEVNRWVVVERLAVAPALLNRLAEDWTAYRGALTTVRKDWREHVEDFLRDNRLAGQE